MSFDNAKVKVGAQASALATIPSLVISAWPAWFSFSVVDYIMALAMSMLPDPKGVAGTIVRAGANGFVKVTNQVTWDVLRSVTS